jgi:hypothetical protein
LAVRIKAGAIQFDDAGSQLGLIASVSMYLAKDQNITAVSYNLTTVNGDALNDPDGASLRRFSGYMIAPVQEVTAAVVGNNGGVQSLYVLLCCQARGPLQR